MSGRGWARMENGRPAYGRNQVEQVAKASAYWNEKREAILLDMVRAGRSGGQTATVLGNISRAAVIAKARRLGLRFGSANLTERAEPKPKRAPTYDVAEIVRMNGEGEMDITIAAKLNISRTTVRKVRRQLGLAPAIVGPPPPTPEQADMVEAMWIRHVEKKAIREATGLTMRQVRGLVTKLCQARARAPQRKPKADRDQRLVSVLLKDGGMPRVVLTGRGPIWVGADNRPWMGVSA